MVSAKAKRGFLPRPLPSLCFVATDLDWSDGSGDEVQATAADLALAMTGRRVRLDALAGPGAPAMTAWVSS